MDWIDDPWLVFVIEILDDFYKMHRQNLPEDQYLVWNENEIDYFCLSFTLWSAKSKYQPIFSGRKRSAFDERASQYRKFINESYIAINLNKDISSENLSFDLYIERENEYIPLMMKGGANIFRASTGKIYIPACSSFVNHACKRYIIPEKELVKIINYWLIDKQMEFDKKVAYELVK